MGWFKTLAFLFLLINHGILYHQDDYIVTNERFEFSVVNPEYIYGKVHNIMYNRTTRAANITIVLKKDFGNALEAAVQGYKFSSNEYRLFPIVMRVNVCDVISKDTFGAQNIYICGNFTKCPLRKGSYHICNWAPDQSKFPPYHPRGRFMAEITLYYFDMEVGQIRWYTKVESKIKWN